MVFFMSPFNFRSHRLKKHTQCNTDNVCGFFFLREARTDAPQMALRLAETPGERSSGTKRRGILLDRVCCSAKDTLSFHSITHLFHSVRFFSPSFPQMRPKYRTHLIAQRAAFTHEDAQSDLVRSWCFIIWTQEHVQAETSGGLRKSDFTD